MEDSGAEKMGDDADKGEMAAEDERIFKRRRLIRTASKILLYISLGLYHGIIGPTLLDLAQLYHTSITSVTSVFTAKAAGIVCGSFVGGMVSDHLRMRSDMILAGITLLNAVSITLTPWATYISLLGGCFFVQGIVHGTTNVLCSSLVLAEWSEKAPSPLNFMHAGFGLGLLISPPLVMNFLSRPVHPNTISIYRRNETAHPVNQVVASMMTPISVDNVTKSDVVMGTSYIAIPYAIIGTFGFLFTFAFMFFYLQKWHYKPRTNLISKQENVENPTQEQILELTKMKRLRVFMAISLFLLYIFVDARENSLTLFAFTVGVDGMGFSKVTADLYNFVYTMSYLVGRLCCVLLTKFVNIKITIAVMTLLALLFSILLQVIGFAYALNLWMLTVLEALTMSPAYASFMAWADRYIEVSGMIVCVIDLGIGCGEFISAYLGGYLVDNWGARTIYTMMLVASVWVTALWILIQGVCAQHGDRYDVQRKPSGGTELSSDGHAVPHQGEPSDGPFPKGGSNRKETETTPLININ